MKPLMVLPELALAEEDRWLGALGELERRAPGVLAVQVRIPGATSGRLLAWGTKLKRALPGVPLVVNDRLDVAAALGAEGVHLGRGSVGVGEARALLGSGLWVSRSCHDDQELEQAAREGASAALLSPIHASPGKGPPLGLARLQQACWSHPHLPILALGGVEAGHVLPCLAAGARGVALIRGALELGRWSAPELEALAGLAGQRSVG
jgi:thiamine-phosphate pyrophosphorylase